MMRAAWICFLTLGLLVTAAPATQAATYSGTCDEGDPDCGPICRDEYGRVYVCGTPPPGRGD